MLSVSEASARVGLSVQRVRALIDAGQLPAQRIGRQWAIVEADLARHEARHGRALSWRSCWALLDLAAAEDSWLGPSSSPRSSLLLGEPVGALSSSDRARARQRLGVLRSSAEAPRLLRSWLPGRAQRQVFAMSPRDLDDLRADQRVVLSGLSHPLSSISAADVAEGYVGAADVEDLVGEYLLLDASERRGNVVLHVTPGRIRQVSQLLLAADLAEHREVRADARAAELVQPR